MENDYSLPVIYAIHIKMNWQLHVKAESFLRLNVNVFIRSLTWITGQEVGRETAFVQNEFISDVASFTTGVQTYLLQGFFFRRW